MTTLPRFSEVTVTATPGGVRVANGNIRQPMTNEGFLQYAESLGLRCSLRGYSYKLLFSQDAALLPLFQAARSMVGVECERVEGLNTRENEVAA